MNRIIHYYIYYRNGRKIIYERTCGTEQSADERVKVLRERDKKEAWWTTDVLDGAFY